MSDVGDTNSAAIAAFDVTGAHCDEAEPVHRAVVVVDAADSGATETTMTSTTTQSVDLARVPPAPVVDAPALLDRSSNSGNAAAAPVDDDGDHHHHHHRYGGGAIGAAPMAAATIGGDAPLTPSLMTTMVQHLVTRQNLMRQMASTSATPNVVVGSSAFATVGTNEFGPAHTGTSRANGASSTRTQYERRRVVDDRSDSDMDSMVAIGDDDGVDDDDDDDEERHALNIARAVDGTVDGRGDDEDGDDADGVISDSDEEETDDVVIDDRGGVDNDNDEPSNATERRRGRIGGGRDPMSIDAVAVADLSSVLLDGPLLQTLARLRHNRGAAAAAAAARAIGGGHDGTRRTRGAVPSAAAPPPPPPPPARLPPPPPPPPPVSQSYSALDILVDASMRRLGGSAISPSDVQSSQAALQYEPQQRHVQRATSSPFASRSLRNNNNNNMHSRTTSSSSVAHRTIEGAMPVRPEPLLSAERRQRLLHEQQQQYQQQQQRQLYEQHQRQQQHQQQQQQQRNQSYAAFIDSVQTLMRGGDASGRVAAMHNNVFGLDATTAAAVAAAAANRNDDDDDDDDDEEPDCDHNLRDAYTHVFDVPIAVCSVCDAAVIAPSRRDECKPQATYVPMSMRRDNRFRELFELHAEHLAIARETESMLRRQRAVNLRFYEWEKRYNDHMPINYAAQNNPCFREMARSMDRYTNQLQAFANVSLPETLEHRRRFVKTVHRAFPRNGAFFKAAMRHEIKTAHPMPMLLPGLNALPKCTVCGHDANVRLHAHAERYVTVGVDPLSGEPLRVAVRRCTCQEFLMCVDCTLDWYWTNSHRLRKSFATCPTCKAEFRLEDIVPVYVAPHSAHDAHGDFAGADDDDGDNDDASVAAAAAVGGNVAHARDDVRRSASGGGGGGGTGGSRSGGGGGGGGGGADSGGENGARHAFLSTSSSSAAASRRTQRRA